LIRRSRSPASATTDRASSTQRPATYGTSSDTVHWQWSDNSKTETGIATETRTVDEPDAANAKLT
jgi:hypothetical protein